MTVEITLPDQLALEAREAGLLVPEQLEQWLRAQLKARKLDELFSAMERMHAVDDVESMTPEIVAEEIALMRAERRSSQSTR